MTVYNVAPRNSSRVDHPNYPDRRHLTDFARQITIAEFGGRYARALDQDGFIDRAPNQLPAPSPEARLK